MSSMPVASREYTTKWTPAGETVAPRAALSRWCASSASVTARSPAVIDSHRASVCGFERVKRREQISPQLRFRPGVCEAEIDRVAGYRLQRRIIEAVLFDRLQVLE